MIKALMLVTVWAAAVTAAANTLPPSFDGKAIQEVR